MKIHQTKKVLSAGALVLDIVPVFQEEEGKNERAAAGGTVYLKRIDTAIGGAVGNTGLTLHKLGAETTIFSRVGKDALGDMVKTALEKTGCAYDISVVEGMNTSASVVVAKPGEDRMILHGRGASQQYGQNDIPQKLLEENDLFQFGYPTGMECMYSDRGENLSGLYRRAKSYGITTAMDLSFPGIDTPSGRADWHEIFRKTLPYVDIFLPSFEEIFLILHREKYLELREKYPDMKLEDIFSLDLVSEMGKELVDLGARIAVIKCGSMGSYVRTGSKEGFRLFGRAADIRAEEWAERELYTPPVKVPNIVSTNGAGDTFVAGYLLGILLGKNIFETLQFAGAAAAARITSPNGRDGVPGYDEIEAMIEKGLEVPESCLPDRSWSRNAMGIYIRN